MVLVICFAIPGYNLYGQADLWETLIKQGNTALAAGNIESARDYYFQALDLTNETLSTDLAPYTTLRNIAQSFVQSANLEIADSIYALIIPKISLLLVTDHSYRLKRLEEQADIREAIRLASIIPVPHAIRLTFWEKLEKWWLHLAVYSRLRAGPTIPLGAQFSTSHTKAMSFDLFLKSPWLEMGSIPVDLGVRRTIVHFSGKHLSSSPISLTGLDITINPLIGRLTLSGGAGIYNTYHGGDKGVLPGITAGAGWVVLENRNSDQQRIFIEVSGHFTVLLGQIPTTDESLMLFNLGANIGYRW
jgi:hypothetical protein